MEGASAQEDASALSDQNFSDGEDLDVDEFLRLDEKHNPDRPSTPPNLTEYCPHCYRSLLHMNAQDRNRHRKRCEKSFEAGKRRPGTEKAKKTIICQHCNKDISGLAKRGQHRRQCKKRQEAKARKDQGETIICTYCSKDIAKLNDPDGHRSRCKAKHATQALGTPNGRLVQLDDIEAAAQPGDTSLNPVQEVSSCRVLMSFSNIIQPLSRTALAPRTAFPKQHEIIADVENTELGLAAFVRAKDIDLPKDANQDRHLNSYRINLKGFTAHDAVSFVLDGVVPILERFVVPPHQLPREKYWLFNAAKLLAMQSDSTFQLRYVEPAIIHRNGHACARVEIEGVDPTSPIPAPHTWRYSFIVYPFLGGTTEKLEIINLEKIAWRRRAKEDKEGKALLEDAPGWKLALLLKATFDGFLGTKPDARNQIRVMINRLTAPSATTTDMFQNLSSASMTAVRAQIPWEVKAFSKFGGVAVITAQPSVTGKTPLTVILLRSLDVKVVVEVLTSMLVRLVTGSDFREVFARGCLAADQLAEDIEEGVGVTDPLPCVAADRSVHWHICTGCFDGFPCSFFPDPSQLPLLCSECAAVGKAEGWKLDLQLYDQDEFPEELLQDATSPQVLPGQNFAKPVRESLLQYVRNERRAAQLGSSRDEVIEETDAIMAKLREVYQADRPTTWKDQFVKEQVLDEKVQRQLSWSGTFINLFVPSIEAVHMVFLKDGISRYHALGNVAITTWSMNLMVGSNPKIVAKAIAQYLSASSPEDYEAAAILFQRCSMVRFELELNQLWKKIGVSETPYLQMMAQCYSQGTLPDQRYVPRDIFLNTGRSVGRKGGPDWLPENFEKYLRPQIENVAIRYGFQTQDRDLWTMKDDSITGGQDVPFIFSKDSIVVSWNWFGCYSWFCVRLKRLLEFCDRHSLEAYKDNPESRDTMNIERFILSLLHIHLWKLDRNRCAEKQWPGQRLRALDDA
ncbi:hypothetical protein LTR67_008811 [Exophiala xenobiotica]